MMYGTYCERCHVLFDDVTGHIVSNDVEHLCGPCSEEVEEEEAHDETTV